MNKLNLDKFLITLDIANNTNGKLEKGIKIIEEFNKVLKEFPEFQFCYKFQYRQLNNNKDNCFIHPYFLNDFSYKYIKRFQETKLSDNDFEFLINKIKSNGYLVSATPFDNVSVPIIKKQELDFIKIASCSCTDFPLLEEVVKVDLPIIVSTAGVSLEEIDKIVLFLKNRDKDFALLHCVAEYPTLYQNLQLNQIDLLKQRYPNIPIGLSSHFDPDNVDVIKLGIAKGINIFECHIDIDCETKNAYSVIPKQLKNLLEAASESLAMCGVENQRYTPLEKELSSLKGLRRCVFANDNLKKGTTLNNENVFYAIPSMSDDHLTANDISKYTEYVLKRDISKNETITFKDVILKNKREDLLKIVNDIRKIILESKIVLPEIINLELSHHYGIEDYYSNGVCIITYLNEEEYCKKYLLMLSGQNHPQHSHKVKQETFLLHYGDLILTFNNNDEKSLGVGELFTIHREAIHGFKSKNGCLFEEISSKHLINDSFYSDKAIMNNFYNRKTKVTLRREDLKNEIK